MSNFVIPYAFTPGTKAKASEVNANFNAIADEIVDFKSNVASQIETVNNTITNSTSDKTDTYLSNAVNLTGGILSAPNGVATYSSNKVTAKSGLKLLIPNGRNSDGTLNNIIYEAPSDITLDLGTLTETGCLFLASDGTIANWAKADIGFIVKPLTTGLYYIYYDIDANLWKYTLNGADYKPLYGTVITEFTSSSGIVNSLNCRKTITLLKDTDKFKISNWLRPDYTSVIGEPWGSNFTAPCDGEIYAFALHHTNHRAYLAINGYSFIFGAGDCGSYGGTGAISMNVAKGDVICASGGVNWYFVLFIPLKGVK